MAEQSPSGSVSTPAAPKCAPAPPETVSAHQVAAMARILGLNPDNVVAVHAEQTRVDVVLFDPPPPGSPASHPLLRQVTYRVER